jgi:hypothetical protein
MKTFLSVSTVAVLALAVVQVWQTSSERTAVASFKEDVKDVELRFLRQKYDRKDDSGEAVIAWIENLRAIETDRLPSDYRVAFAEFLQEFDELEERIRSLVENPEETKDLRAILREDSEFRNTYNQQLAEFAQDVRARIKSKGREVDEIGRKYSLNTSF